MAATNSTTKGPLAPDSSALNQLINSLSSTSVSTTLPKPRPRVTPKQVTPSGFHGYGEDTTSGFPPEFYTSQGGGYTQQSPLNNILEKGSTVPSPKAKTANTAASLFGGLGNIINTVGDMAMLPLESMNKILNSILEKEGKVANYKEDKGGFTNMGITAKALAEYKGVPVTSIKQKDLLALTPGDAKRIYKDQYISKAGYDDIDSEGVTHLLADMSVHHGREGSAKLAQRALNTLGYKVSTDGQFGPQSKAAMQAALAKQGEKKVLEALVNVRKQRFNEIVKADPSQKKFYDGWINRANSFLPSKTTTTTKKTT